MANVRIAQSGQLAANRPIYEVMVDDRRYAFAVLENGRVQFKNRAYMFALGLCSVVCQQYKDAITLDDARLLNLDNNLSCDRSNRFSAQTFGTGFRWHPQYSVFSGWSTVFPTNAIQYTV